MADLLAHTYDINLAVDARAATELEWQTVRWLADFLGFPAQAGTFTSGGGAGAVIESFGHTVNTFGPGGFTTRVISGGGAGRLLAKRG